MASASAIEWTELTWNPVRGCTVLSPGCTHCYAMKQARRQSGPGMAYEGLTRRSKGGPVWTGEVRLVEELVEAPLRWQKPRLVFVNSMSDLFHEDVPEEFIARIFGVMARASQHVFQILTKRSDRLRQMAPKLAWPENVWMGVSVERADYLFRVDDLRAVPAAVRFLSLEPLLGPLPDLDLSGVGWVIVGGESGSRARPMDPAWVLAIRQRCAESGVPFFFKQWGGRFKKRTGRLLEGRTWDGMPARPGAELAGSPARI